MIAGKAEVAHAKGDVVAKVAGGMDGFQLPAVAFNDVAIRKKVIGGKVHVDAFSTTRKAAFSEVLHHGAASGEGIAKGPNLGAATFGEGRGQWGVVDMGVGHQDVADALPRLKGGHDRLEVGCVLGAGVDHGQFACANQIGVGATERHRRGIGCQNAPHAGTKRFGYAGPGVELQNFGVHGLSFCAVSRQGLAMYFDWLKRYMPRSLYGRAAMILVLPIVTLQLVVTTVFIQRHFEGVTKQMTRGTAQEVNLVIEAINDLAEGEEQEAELRDISDYLSITPTVGVDEPQENYRRWFDFSGLVVISTFEALVPGLRKVELLDDKVLEIYVETEQGLTRLSIDRRRVSARNPHRFLVIMVSFGVLMTVISFLYMRNQLRPITRLSRAAEAFGRGRHVPYTPTGAIEVRAAGNAFLDMRARIERQIEQRTMMLSGVSHDLRTPLTRLRLGLSFLDKEDAEPLERDVEDMQRLLDEFLSFARGASEGEPEDVDPIAMVETLVEDSARGGNDVVLGVVSGSGTVKIRPVGMKRAVENLIGNAVRYGTRAEVSVELSEKFLRIRVEDDGPGIPEAQREEALKPFARLEPGRNQNKGTGVGLGLAIAADVARAHGGVLRLADSERLGGLCADIVIAR